MSEKRLIDANALRAKVCGWFHRDPQEADDQDECAAALCMAIDEAPTVEAVEVVRCENCVHSREIKGTPKKWYFTDRVMHCAELRGSASDDGISAVWRNGYCDDGKRKES